MARHTTRLGLLTMAAGALRTAMRPGSAGLAERAAAVPRMLHAVARGDYRGTTFAHVALLAAAVVYIVSPVDLVPEALFGIIGLGDDAVVVTWLAAALVADTEAFLLWERGASGRGAAGSPGPQDAPRDEYHRTVRSQVVG